MDLSRLKTDLNNKKSVLSQVNHAMTLYISMDTECAGSFLYRLILLRFSGSWHCRAGLRSKVIKFHGKKNSNVP